MFVYVFAQCLHLCVGCMAFAHVCVRILRVKRLVHTYTAFLR